MTGSDDLLSKADALLARRRTGAIVPGPPADYPVLTEIVMAPSVRDKSPLPELPSDDQVPLSEESADAEPMGIPMPDARQDPTYSALPAPEATDALPAALDSDGEFPILTSIDGAQAPADTTMRAIEERVYLRVLDAIEPYVDAFIEEPLRLRIEELARDLATAIARDARSEILMLVRDAVRSAVAHEFEARRDE